MLSKEREKILPFFAFAGIFTFWLWRIQYGAADAYSGLYDEAFYIATPYRMLFGDLLLFDETIYSQLFAFLTYPLVWLYQIIMGGTEGIVLAFRLLWVCFHLATAVFAYMLMRKQYYYAIFAAVFFSLARPVGFSALSYNTIPLMTVTILILLYYLGYDAPVINIYKGFLLATVVLCNPYCIVLYLAILAVQIAQIAKEDKRVKRGGVTALIQLHIGIALLLIPFILYFVINMIHRGIGFSQFLLQIVEIMRSGEGDGHGVVGGSIGSLLLNKAWFAIDFALMFGLFPVLYLPIVVAGVVKKRLRRNCLLMVLALCTAFSVYAAVKYTACFVLCFLFFLALAAGILYWDIFKRKFLLAYTLAILFVVATEFCSNTQLHAVSWACVPAGVLSFLMLEEVLANEEVSVNNSGVICFRIATVLMIIVCGAVMFHDYHGIPREQQIPNLTSKISEGPLKGLYTTQERSELYAGIYRNLTGLQLDEDDKVLTHPLNSIDILILQREVCAPTAYIFGGLASERAERYYLSHVDKIPTVIFVNKLLVDGLCDEECLWLVRNGYILSESTEDYDVYRLRKDGNGSNER